MKYHKIRTLFERTGKGKNVIPWHWSIPEFEVLEYLNWNWYEKIDGMNIRIEYKDTNILVEGREQDSQIPDKLNNYLNEITNTSNFLTFCYDYIYNKEIVIYGEGCDNHVRSSGRYGEPNFFVFDICINGFWLDQKNIENICKQLDLNYVTLYNTGTLAEGTAEVMSGQKSAYGNFIMEGLIFKPPVRLFRNDGERIIGKLKHTDFYGT